MNRTILAVLVALVASLAVAPAQAATILLDFGQPTQETALSSWNNISGTANPGAIPAGPYSLNYTTGLDSNIDLGISTSGTVGFSGLGANYGGPYPAAVSSYPTTANQDGIYTIGGSITGTLSNLNPLATYDFLFYGADGNAAAPGVATTWTVTGLNSGNATIPVTHNNSTSVAIVNSIIPNLSNQISIVMTSPGIGRWNLIAITEVLPQAAPIPEPATGLALGLGALALLVCRPRRRR